MEIYTKNHTHLTQMFYPGNPTWENQHSMYLSISYSRKVQKFTVTELCLADKLTVQIRCPSSIPDCLPISESPIMKWYTLAWDPLTPRLHECASQTLHSHALTNACSCTLAHSKPLLRSFIIIFNDKTLNLDLQRDKWSRLDLASLDQRSRLNLPLSSLKSLKWPKLYKVTLSVKYKSHFNFIKNTLYKVHV